MNSTDKLVLAAVKLEKKGKKPFSAEDLVVSAWKLFPNSFGLAGNADEKGIPLYPDSNRVFVEIMGSKPIRKKGYLEKVGNKMYQLTQSGRNRAEYLNKDENASEVAKLSFSRELQQELNKLLLSRAYDKYKKGALDEITFFDACLFLNITTRSTANDLRSKLSNFDGVLQMALSLFKDEKNVFRIGIKLFNKSDLIMLKETKDYLLNTFKPDFEHIMTRLDER